MEIQGHTSTRQNRAVRVTARYKYFLMGKNSPSPFTSNSEKAGMSFTPADTETIRRPEGLTSSWRYGNPPNQKLHKNNSPQRHYRDINLKNQIFRLENNAHQ